MDLNWITHPLTMYSLMAAGGLAALHLVVSTKRELSREQSLREEETSTLLQTLKALQKTVDQLQTEARERESWPAPTPPGAAMNLQRRSQALRMYRRGDDSQTIASALSLPHAQVALLEKVHRVLSAT